MTEPAGSLRDFLEDDCDGFTGTFQFVDEVAGVPERFDRAFAVPIFE